MEERRLLLAVALSFLVLLGYRWLYPPAPAPAPGASAPGTAAGVQAPPPSPPPAEAPPVAAAEAAVADEKERRVEVDANGALLAFSNRGARLLSWRLGAFKDARGAPEELVRTPPGGPRPLDLETGEPQLDQRLRDALFQPSSEALHMGDAEAELRFRWAEGELAAEKVLRFRPGTP